MLLPFSGFGNGIRKKRPDEFGAAAGKQDAARRHAPGKSSGKGRFQPD
jgi:hypothetical protein